MSFEKLYPFTGGDELCQLKIDGANPSLDSNARQLAFLAVLLYVLNVGSHGSPTRTWGRFAACLAVGHAEAGANRG